MSFFLCNGERFDGVLDEVEPDAEHVGVEVAGPGYLSYVEGEGLSVGVVHPFPQVSHVVCVKVPVAVAEVGDHVGELVDLFVHVQ